jgi:Cu-Zn family superoxide dismutase
MRGLLTNFGTIGANITGAASVGSHFDPYGTNKHLCPDSSGTNNGSHAGDLGNWKATGGKIDAVKSFSNFSLDGPVTSVVGRTIVVHDTFDDCLILASSGSRIGIGVIGIKNVNSTDTNNAKAGTGFNKAVCVFAGTSDCSGTNCAVTNSGFVYFSQIGNIIRITSQVFGIASSERGFHIHNFGDTSSSTGTNAGGHWNPENKKHGFPGQSELHLGDLGNIKTFSSNPNFGIYDNNITSSSTYWKIDNIIGRAVIVHSTIDHGNEATCLGSSDNGAAGKRVYQCVIGIINPANQSEPLTHLPSINTSPFTFSNTWKNTPCSPANIYSFSLVLLVFLVFINFLF